MICSGKNITKKRGVVFFLSAVISMLCLMPGLSSASTPDNKEVSKKVGKLQVPFIANNGQMDDKVGFYAKTFGGTVFVTKGGEIVYSLPEKGVEPNSKTKKEINKEKTGKKELKASSFLKGIALKESLLDGNITVVKGEKKSETNISYFKGNDQSKYKSNISAYDIVSMGEVYKGIELKLRAYGNNVEKLFYVKPGIDAGTIKMQVEGAKELKVNDKGELELLTELGTVSFTKPVAYQEVNGKRVEVSVEYVLDTIKPSSGLHNIGVEGSKSELPTLNSKLAYGFKLGAYDKTKELVIDPLLASTLIGGNDSDYAYAIAVDSSGNVFVAGGTLSIDYPTTQGSYDTSYNGSSVYYSGDIFISKLNNDLTDLLASTYIGGNDADGIGALAIDSSGNVFVAGGTDSTDYPITSGAYNTTDTGLFISKFDNKLTSLLASTFIKGCNGASGLALDAYGNVFVTGSTSSTYYPTTVGIYDSSFHGLYDVFVSKLNNKLTSLLASTFIGGSSGDYARAVTVDSSGNVFVAGDTDSSDYPTTSGAYDTTFNDSGNSYYKGDVFVSKLSNNLTTLFASTFIGGGFMDDATALAIDSSGNIFVTGNTYSSDYPTTSGAYDTFFGNGDLWYTGKVFISKLNNNLTSLLASTFIGGGGDYVYGLAIDLSGNVFVTGDTGSSLYPTTPGAFDTTFNDGDYYNWPFLAGDAFISKLNGSLTSLLASTYIGGTGYVDTASAIAIDPAGNVFVAGITSIGCCANIMSVNDAPHRSMTHGMQYASSNYPTTIGAYNTTFNNSYYEDSFVSKLDGNLSAGGALTDICAATLTTDLNILVPISVYGPNYYTANMQYASGMDFKVPDIYQLITNGSLYSYCLSSAPTVAPDLSVHMPVIMFDGVSYWADFIYKGNMTWTMTQAGQN